MDLCLQFVIFWILEAISNLKVFDLVHVLCSWRFMIFGHTHWWYNWCSKYESWESGQEKEGSYSSHFLCLIWFWFSEFFSFLPTSFFLIKFSYILKVWKKVWIGRHQFDQILQFSPINKRWDSSISMCLILFPHDFSLSFKESSRQGRDTEGKW